MGGQHSLASRTVPQMWLSSLEMPRAVSVL